MAVGVPYYVWLVMLTPVVVVRDSEGLPPKPSLHGRAAVEEEQEEPAVVWAQKEHSRSQKVIYDWVGLVQNAQGEQEQQIEIERGV